MTKNPSSVTISGRTAAIVKWIIEQSVFLDAIQRGSLTLNFAGRNISPQIKICPQNISVDETNGEVTISK